jgi:DnaJ-class molecular chaperone
LWGKGPELKDCYEKLDLDRNATEEEIRSAYRRLARCTHPDCQGGDEERFKEIQQAYEILIDPEKRKEHSRRQSRMREGASHRPDSVRPGKGAGTGKPPAAQLVLKSFEARQGGRVSLDIPVLRSCPVCSGRGVILGFYCPFCSGEGQVRRYHTVELAYPPGVQDGERFFLDLQPFGYDRTLEMEVVIE